MPKHAFAILKRTVFSLFVRKPLSYLSGITALQQAPALAEKIDLYTALAFLDKRYKYYSPASVTYLKILYRYLISQKKDDYPDRYLEVQGMKKKIILHFCCWGEAYTEKVLLCLWPSLLAPENLPFIAKHCHVTLLIHCDAQTKIRLLAFPSYPFLSQFVDLEFIIIPDKLISAHAACFNHQYFPFSKKLNAIHKNVKYLLLGGLQTYAFQVALKERAFISFLMPDMLISDCFYKRIFEMIQDKKAVLLTTVRANYQPIKQHLLTDHHARDKSVLAIKARSLVKLHLAHIHAMTKQQVISESTDHFIPSAQLVFKINNGYVIRALHYHPVLLDCSEINHKIKMDYYPIDNSILSSLFDPKLPYDTQISIANDASKIHCIELSDEAPSENKPPKFTRRKELVDAVRKMVLNNPALYNTPYNRYLSTFQYVMIDENSSSPSPADQIDERSFFAEINYL